MHTTAILPRIPLSGVPSCLGTLALPGKRAMADAKPPGADSLGAPEVPPHVNLAELFKQAEGSIQRIR